MLPGPGDELLGPAGGEFDGALPAEEVPRAGAGVPVHPRVGPPAIGGGGQEGLHRLALGGGGRPEEVDDRKRHLPHGHVGAQGLAHLGLLAVHVEAVVHDLEGEADPEAEGVQGPDGRLPSPRVARPHLGGGGVEDGGLLADDLEVALLGEVEVPPLAVLEDLPLADLGGDLGEVAGGEPVREGGAEGEGPGEEEVPEEHRPLVPVERVAGGDLAAEHRLVQHVVMHEGRRVDHLHHHGHRYELRVPLARAAAREEDEGGAEALPREALGVGHHLRHERMGGAALLPEERLHGTEIVLHRGEGVGELDGRNRRPVHGSSKARGYPRRSGRPQDPLGEAGDERETLFAFRLSQARTRRLPWVGARRSALGAASTVPG